MTHVIDQVKRTIAEQALNKIRIVRSNRVRLVEYDQSTDVGHDGYDQWNAAVGSVRVRAAVALSARIDHHGNEEVLFAVQQTGCSIGPMREQLLELRFVLQRGNEIANVMAIVEMTIVDHRVVKESGKIVIRRENGALMIARELRLHDMDGLECVETHWPLVAVEILHVEREARTFAGAELNVNDLAGENLRLTALLTEKGLGDDR